MEKNELSYEQLLERIKELEAKVQAKAEEKPLTIKASEKGAVSVYGLGRFPVTLYYEQWLRLLAIGEKIKTFGETHKAQLRSKGDELTPEQVAAIAARDAAFAAKAAASKA